MKEFIKSSLIEFGVIILVVSLFDGIEINEWRNFIIFFEIFIVVLTFRTCSLFTGNLHNRFYILDVLVEFFTTLIIVLFFAYIFGWCIINEIWDMCLIVFVVYGLCYILGLANAKKNADYINDKLLKRRERINEMKQSNKEIMNKEGNYNEERK